MTESTETAVVEIVERARREAEAMHAAPSGNATHDTFHAFNWPDKPTRVLYDAVALIREAATALEAEHAARVKAEGERDGLVRRIRIFERANTEMHRAEVTAEQPRLQRAGDRYYLAKLRLFDRARALLQGEPS